MDEPPPTGTSRLPILLGSILLAIATAVAAFWLLDGSTPAYGAMTISLTFLLVLPAALAAMISYLTDLDGRRTLGHHFRVPFLLIGGVLGAGVILLQEGVICIAMLVPLWLPAALAGSLLTYGLRLRIRERGRLFCTALLLIPLSAAQIEGQNPPQPEPFVVTSAVIVDAPPERVWPVLVAIPDIAPEEGRWNVAQDLLGIPRPVSASLERRGSRLVRSARWGSDVRFEEHVTRWQPGQAVAWRFAFPDESVREHTDRHIAPDGAHLRIERGSYRLESLPSNRTRVILETRYVLRTPLNRYAAWWGDLLLGGIQENVLAIVKQRAEG